MKHSTFQLGFVLLAAGALSPARTTLHAQTTVPYFNRNLIVLDPAHGGQDNGASLAGQPEKAVTLALATSLKTLLTARGFTVVSTREADLPDATQLTPDQRAGTANHLRPAACIVLHATATGTGLHLITSSLTLADAPYDNGGALPWETLQADYSDRSQHLANDLGLALVHEKISALLLRATLRPLDNLTCPAVAIEVAPLANGSKLTRATDSAYQQRIAETLAAALLEWRDRTSPRPAPKPAATPATGATPAGATP